MEIKEQIIEELKKYVDTFKKYDNELPKLIEEKEKSYEESKKEFDEKWGDDIFPTDIPIKEQEEKNLEKFQNDIKELKQNKENEIKEAEVDLKRSVLKWGNNIDERREELVNYIKDKNKYLEEKSRLEKELESQIDGIKVWEKNGINTNDSVYRRRKDEIIPNLKNQIENINLKLNENKIREEYKELGELKKKINEVKLHDRKHMLPELADIFEIDKTKAEPVKPEPVKPEPVKPEPVKPEPVKPEPVKPEPVKAEPVKAEPVKAEPVNAEPVKAEPVKAEPVKAEPIKAEPIKAEPVKLENEKDKIKDENEGPFINLIIGKKIKVKFLDDGVKFTIAKSKDYFKYMKKNKNGATKINSQLYKKLGIEKENSNISLNDVDPMIVYSLIKGLEQELMEKQDVIDAIKAIKSRDKSLLDKSIPIKIDKKNASRFLLPWNKKIGKNINEIADKNTDIIESIGEYEPNLFKRFFKSAKKSLQTKEEPELLTDGDEKQNDEEQKETKKLNERVDIKLSETFKSLSSSINDIKTTDEAKVWYKFLEEEKSNGSISEKESEALLQFFNDKLQELRYNYAKKDIQGKDIEEHNGEKDDQEIDL